MKEEGATQPAPDGSAMKEPPEQPEQPGGPSRDRERGRRRHPNQPRRPEHQLPMPELRDLFVLFSEHGLTEFELEREGFRVHLGRNLTPQIVTAPVTTQSHANSAQSATAPTETGGTGLAEGVSLAEPEEIPAEESLTIIKSPIVGTFYRSPSPTAEPFVRLGSHVSSDSVVCIIEAMKLMNEIQAEVSGEIAKIYVENGQPVEFDQPLFGIKK